MDQVKIGNFIAELRRRDGLTQEALGEKIGVTNKTVSRWENGNYMPDIEMLQMLGDIFHVSINELLAGCYLNDEEFKAESDKNLVNIIKDSAFSYEEKFTFWKRKWLISQIYPYSFIVNACSLHRTVEPLSFLISCHQSYKLARPSLFHPTSQFCK